jgi:hypothetical protein
MNDDERTLSQDERRMRQSKVYRHEPARPFLTHRKSVSPLPQEVTDPVEVEKLICEFLFDETLCRFLPSQRALKIASLTPKTGNGDIGLLFRDFRLSQIRKILSRAEKSEAEDRDILSCLDKLSLTRKLKVINAEISKWTHFSDCSFCAECGVCINEVRQSSGWTLPKLFDVHFYRDEPLSKANFEWGGRAIVDVSERVQKLRARRDAHFQRAFGWSNFIEARLHRADLEDEVKLKTAILKLASKIDKSDKPDEDKQE